MKLIVVTPAGREKYLRLLSHYVLGSPEVDGWQLWDNCRTASDRAYLRQLAASDPRCSIEELPGADGGFGIIGDFYRFCDDPDAIYLRLDDDVVFIEDGFFRRFRHRMLAERGRALWFSPLVINNAVCSSLIAHLSKVLVKGPVSCQAMCPYSWAHASFPMALHPVFIEAARTGRLDDFRVPDREVRTGRFSVNAIAFFGSEIVAMGESFLPPAHNEEEWFSVILPMKLDRPGRILGDLIVAHFSFYTQEQRLLQTDILESYYALAGLPPPTYRKPANRKRLKDILRPWKKRKDQGPHYQISLRGADVT